MWRYFSKLFWLSTFLFCLHQLVQLKWSIPYLHAYLDDVLAPPIVLGLCLVFFQRVFPADPNYQLPFSLILIFVLWYALLFEWIFPSYDLRHYADIFDVFAYFSGALIFWKWGNYPQQGSKP